jgi:predicted porin
MKKHLIAAAVAGALAVPAMAQVTVSGYLEAAYNSTDRDGGTDTARFESGGFGSSRIVFTGSEDLGGGLKAGFRLESSVDVTSGRMGSATVGSQSTTGPIFDRGAEVSLSGGFGSVAIGKFDHAGIEGNDINVFGNWALGESAVEAGQVASDVNGSVRYVSPAFGGFTLNVSHTPDDNGNKANDDGEIAASSKGHSGITSYQLTGKVGGLAIRAGGGTVKDVQTGADAVADGDTKVTGFGASYDFGMASAAAYYQKQTNPGDTEDVKQTVVSVKVPLSNGLDVRALYETIDNPNTRDEKNTMVAVVKALSKRTSVYGYYRSVDQDDDADGEQADSTVTGIAVSHSF